MKSAQVAEEVAALKGPREMFYSKLEYNNTSLQCRVYLTKLEPVSPTAVSAVPVPARTLHQHPLLNRTLNLRMTDLDPDNRTQA